MKPRIFSIQAICALTVAAMMGGPASRSRAAEAEGSRIIRLDPAMDALVPADAKIEVLASGLDWAEGPVWRKSGDYVLFVDIPANTIYKWQEGQGLSVFLRPSGHTEADPPPFGRELGCNALTIDAHDRLVMADQGTRRVSWLNESNYTKVTLATGYEGKRFSSPNDLIFRSNGDLYFTDPPYGLTGLNANPTKEIPFNGVYRLTAAGKLILLTKDLTFPNGVAFSPDEKILYVAVSDPDKPVLMAYDVQDDGSIANGRVFFDATALAKAGGQGLPDGLKVDQKGNVFLGGPGGILVLDAKGKHLGTIVTGQITANCGWGDDGSTLYMAANHFFMRVKLSTKGEGF
jgi:gluconolactonase